MGWNQVPQRAQSPILHGKITPRPPPPPSPHLPPLLMTSSPPSPFLSLLPLALSPSSPSLPPLSLLGCPWGLAQPHSPACPAGQALPGHRDGLCVPKGEEEEEVSSPEQGSSPAPPGATLPTTSPPGAGWQQCTRAQHPTAGSVRAHRPAAGRPGAACASGPRKIPSILQPASTATAGTVPGCTPLAPGLPHLQSLQSLGALGTRRAAGRALGGKNKHVLGCGRAVPRHCCPKDKLTCVGSRPGDAGTHRSQHHCILGPCSPPPPVTKLLMHFGPMQRMLSQLLVSRKSPLKGRGNGSSHQEISAALQSLDVSRGALRGRRPSAPVGADIMG